MKKCKHLENKTFIKNFSNAKQFSELPQIQHKSKFPWVAIYLKLIQETQPVTQNLGQCHCNYENVHIDLF